VVQKVFRDLIKPETGRTACDRLFELRGVHPASDAPAAASSAVSSPHNYTSRPRPATKPTIYRLCCAGDHGPGVQSELGCQQKVSLRESLQDGLVVASVA
jgi:hypothetical protein